MATGDKNLISQTNRADNAQACSWNLLFLFYWHFFWKLRLSRHEGPCGQHQMFQALHFSVHVPNAIFMARRVHCYLFISSSCKSYAHQQFSIFVGLATHLYFFSITHCFYCVLFYWSSMNSCFLPQILQENKLDMNFYSIRITNAPGFESDCNTS